MSGGRESDPATQEPASPGRPEQAGVPATGPDLVVDCLGRPCPVPVIELARALPTVEVGAVVEVLSDDPAAPHDVAAWCRMRGQEHLGAEGQAQRVRRLR